MLEGCPNGCGLKRDFFEGFEVGERNARHVTQAQFDEAVRTLSTRVLPLSTGRAVMAVAVALGFDISEVR